MTQLLVAGGLGRVFGGSTQAAVYQKFLLRQQEEERLRRDRKEDLADEAGEVLDFALAIISSSEAHTLRFELDLYGTGAVAALQQNEMELLEARDQVEKLLLKAHVLPDGRRVFKTEDGNRVFDEYGKEIGEEIIHANDIDDRHPRWETFKSAWAKVDALESERTEILDYEDKLDAARERLYSGTMTRKEYEELREELKAGMPEAVRAQIPGIGAEASQDHAVAPADELEVSDDMVPVSRPIQTFTPAFSG